MKKFTFTWRIENYSYCWHETEDELISPVFVADTLQGTGWVLSLFPRGDEEGSPKHISFFLNRSQDSDGPEVFAVHFELSFLGADGSVLKRAETLNDEFSFKRREGVGSPMFLERQVLFAERDAYLPQDTLTARCVMWKGTGDVSESGRCSARTRIGIERVSFVQVVERFSSLQPNEKATALLELIPKEFTFTSIFTTENLYSDENIMVEIGNSERTIYSGCLVFLLDSNGNETPCGPDEASCFTSDQVWKIPLNCTKNMLLEEESKYLPNDTLSLRCECTFITGLEIHKIEQIDHPRPLLLTKDSKPNNCRNLKIRRSAGRLTDYPSASDDFRSLYEDQTLSDVKIKTETETFFAHKSVLCARSPVFKAIFVSDMKEKATDSIQVDDLEDDTVRRLLLFLYSDEVEDLQWETAEKLYYAADKYQVQQLRVMCSSFLMDNLSVSNAIDALVLADRHQDHELKTTVENFIVVRDEEIFRSEAWKTFMKINPLLALETMHFKYEKK